MWIFLPVAALVTLLFFFKTKFISLGWRASYLLSATLLLSLSVLFLEAMSFFGAVTGFTVRLFWLVVAGLSVVALLSSWRKRALVLPAVRLSGSFEWLALLSVGFILLINAFVAFIAPPNNWDSMTYHLPRVMHWATNSNLSFYPTSISRQLFNHPGAEYTLLHIFLLTGDDRWFNFVQWISLVGCIISVSLVARLLGASFRGQLLACLFTATIPMAVLQSTSTQNDLLVSFLVAAFVALALLLQEKFSRIVFIFAAAVLGLSFLVKGTAFVVFPFLCFFIITLWKRISRHLLVGICIMLLLAGGHYLRCWSFQQGRGFLNEGQSALLMQRHDPMAVMVNGVCQLSSELVIPFKPVAQFLVSAPHKIAAGVGINLRQDELFSEVFSGLPSPKFVFDEDYASNPLHVILILLMPVLLWCMKPERKVWLYYACFVAAGLLFLYVIRWQPWITRLHLPLFILAGPLLGFAAARWRWFFVLAVIVLSFVAGVTVISHQTRPLTGPNSLLRIDRSLYYFAKKPGAVRSYFTVASGILSSGCRQVGLIESGDSWEYPLWALTGYGKVRFRKVLTDSQDTLPCLIVTIDSPQESVVAGRVTYIKAADLLPLQVFYPSLQVKKE